MQATSCSPPFPANLSRPQSTSLVPMGWPGTSTRRWQQQQAGSVPPLCPVSPTPCIQGPLPAWLLRSGQPPTSHLPPRRCQDSRGLAGRYDQLLGTLCRTAVGLKQRVEWDCRQSQAPPRRQKPDHRPPAAPRVLPPSLPTKPSSSSPPPASPRAKGWVMRWHLRWRRQQQQQHTNGGGNSDSSSSNMRGNEAGRSNGPHRTRFLHKSPFHSLFAKNFNIKLNCKVTY